MTRHAATREEQALAEIASTEISRGSAWLLVAVFLGVIVGVPLWQELQVRGRDIERPDVGMLLPNHERVLPSVGELRRFEDDLEDESFLRAALLSPVQSLLCRLGAGNEQVYLGREGWLYYRADVEHVTGPGFLEPAELERRRREGDETTDPPEPDPLVGILDLRDQLAARGIELMVVPTPLKPTVHPDYLAPDLAGGAVVRVDNPSMQALFDRLEAEGVDCLDPLSLMQEGTGPHYLATDTHWRPQAMERVAARLGQRVRQLLTPHPERDHRAPERFIRQERRIAGAGDITRMLELEHPESLYADEEIVIHEVMDTHPEDGVSRVLLLGDSFSNIYSLEGMGWGNDAGLAEQLAFALQEPVEALCINDNGSFATRQALRRELVQGNDLLAGKRVVIHQFAARELSLGDWRPIMLPEAEAAQALDDESTGADAWDDRSYQARGIVRAVAPVPHPGSVPYKDAVTAIHLVDVQAEPTLVGGEALVFRWGMRDGVWTSAAALREGDSLVCELVPWKQASAKFGGYNRSELADEKLWELPTFWAPLAEELEPKPAAGVPLARLAESEVVEGDEGWLFFGPELQHLAAGDYWGEKARVVGRASDEELRDPLPAIVDFHQQLARAGIELWVVPVPAKAAIYREHTGASDEEAAGLSDQRFVGVLRESGVRVLDLFTLFETWKQEGEQPLFCKSDTHWSPRACERVASELVGGIESALEDVPRREYGREPRTVEVVGDLERRVEREQPRREELTLSVVREGSRAVRPWRESPVLLVGDSHTLVFHAGGDLLAKGAGLPEQLAAELGFAPDVVGVRGSGSTAARISLLRRRDNLAGKRVCIWVFAARELTQSAEGWRKVPVIRN